MHPTILNAKYEIDRLIEDIQASRDNVTEMKYAARRLLEQIEIIETTKLCNNCVKVCGIHYSKRQSNCRFYES